jgi:uncharacterized protein YecE (DUF72 family)
MEPKRGLAIGTCSWNYESWVGSVYYAPSRTAAGYLGEYSKRFRTAEVDSFFYKLPETRDALSYAEAVDEDFSFTLKGTQDLSLTHARVQGSKESAPNPSFLSADLFAAYLERVRALLPVTEAIMLEFEYLNKDKMRDVGAFMEALDPFVASAPKGLPLAIETRNKNYLTREYFQFLKERSLIHVFSEKQYMPHVYEVYERFGDLISGTSVIRLLGGDRAEIERATGGSWDRIVDAKPDKLLVAGMSREIVVRGGRVIVSINNHYEGSAPMTALFFEEELGELLAR